ncbi:OmpA family protein [Flavobacteriaceae bacterium Ap0902]|nr:OmpA family protein [Flavobacteriaceae bacterium Ap0902]
MKIIKQLGLTFIILITSSSFAFAQESEVVMTQDELDSFLETVRDARREQLESGKTTKIKRSTTRVKGGEYVRDGGDRVMYQLDRINDRIDNLFMLHAGGVPAVRPRSTYVVPGSNAAATPDGYTEYTIQELQRQLDALKAEQGDADALQSELAKVEDRIQNAQTPEERRDALKDLLAKFKNFKKQVFFANDSDQLNAEDFQYINDVTEVLNKYPELSIVLEGWASTRGNADYNKRLSMRRSESVEKALMNKGISKDRIVSSFRGEDKTTTEPQARRVDMTVILK